MCKGWGVCQARCLLALDTQPRFMQAVWRTCMMSVAPCKRFHLGPTRFRSLKMLPTAPGTRQIRLPPPPAVAAGGTSTSKVLNATSGEVAPLNANATTCFAPPCTYAW